MNPLTQSVIWKASDEARVPWEAMVDGVRWQVRMNEFPEEEFLYSLFINGIRTEEFQDWPKSWTRRQSEVALEGASQAVTQKPGPSLRAWRATLPPQGLLGSTAEVFAVDVGSSERKVAGMADEIGADPHDYVLIGAAGAIIDTFSLTAWSIGEELGASVYTVADGALRQLTASVLTGDTIRVNRVERTIVDNLRPVDGDDDKTLRFLHDTLVRNQQTIAEKNASLRGLGNARAENTPGANGGHRVSDEFHRVQALLRKRVEAYGSETDDAMLRLLERLGKLVQRVRCLPQPCLPALSALESVVETFLVACDPPHNYIDASANASKDAGEFVTLPGGVRAELREIEKLLSVLSSDLNQAGERYEWSDARNSAIQMYHAATYAARARERLEDGFRTAVATMQSLPSKGDTVTSKPADSPVPAGKRHRTSRDLKLLDYAAHSLCSEPKILPVGSIFRPWEPGHRRGEKVPITLGEKETPFNWAVDSPNGYFLSWDDFFSSSELVVSRPADTLIPVGQRYRALCDLELLVVDYDSLGGPSKVLPVGSIFQPWEPGHRRGERVPVTLGDAATEFDWGVSAGDGHFLRWDDFFEHCEPAE